MPACNRNSNCRSCNTGDKGQGFYTLLSACGNFETRGTIHAYDGLAKNECAVTSMQKRIDFSKSVFA
jgi:hypothetical protein